MTRKTARAPTYHAVSRTRARRNAVCLFRTAERIAEAAHRADRVVAEPGRLQLAADVVDVDVDDVGGRLEAVAPHLLPQLVAGQHGALVSHEVLEQRELGARQLDRPLADAHLARVRVQGELAGRADGQDRKSTRLKSSHMSISYAVFCLKKKKKTQFVIISITK